MDTQMENYQILKNGKPLAESIGTLNQVVAHIRLLESHLNRLRQHSPYTISKVKHQPPLIQDRIKIY